MKPMGVTQATGYTTWPRQYNMAQARTEKAKGCGGILRTVLKQRTEERPGSRPDRDG